MATLYYAYSYNITSASAHEKLTVSDIESFAKFAYEKNNFGIAIEIIQSLLQLIPNSKSKINDNFIKNLEK